MLGCQPSTLTQRSMHHQKSSSDSPFHANTLKPTKRGSVEYILHHNGCDHEGKSERINILGSKKERRKGQVSPHGNTEPHLPLPGQLPPHSGWSRCCMLPICTERPELTESPSAPWEKTRVKFEFSSWQKRKINKCV